MRFLAGLLLGLGCAGPVSGQEFHDGGVRLAAAEPGITVIVLADDNDGVCNVSRQVLEAEAERALRRDGVPLADLGSSRAGVFIDVLGLRDRLVSGRAVGCTAAITVRLQAVYPERIVMLAAFYTTVLTGQQETHAGRVRASVEEAVSVISNTLRRERDATRSR